MTPFPIRPALVRASALALALLLAPPVPAGAEVAPRGLDDPAAPTGRSLVIEARRTGRHLENFVDGYVPPGSLPGPGATLPPDGARDAFAPALSSGVGTPWSPLPPPARWVHSTIYDPIRDRLIVFGGQGYSGSSNEVWALALSGIPRWTRLLPSGPEPPPRGFHTAIYDSVRDRMIVFGGDDGAPRNDVWALSFDGNPTWSQLAPTGTPPSPRAWHVAVVDRARNRMIVHGGVAGGTRFADTWALSLGATPAWTLLATAGSAPARSSHCGRYDAAGDRLVVFSGLDGAGAARGDVWALTLGATPTWSTLAPSGTPPSARYGASARYDALRGRALFFGGGTGAPNTNETWALSLTGAPAWTLLPAPNPPQGRQFHSATYDPFGDRLLVFGGSSGPVLSDTWALSLASPGSAGVPLTSTRRRGHSALLDTARRRMIVFGGENGTQLNDVWEFGLAPGGTWARLNPAGTPPSPRALHAAVYDDRRDRMLVFGGRGGPPLNDLWELTFSGSLEWRTIQAQGTPPPPRFDHVTIYDPVRYRILVFGGYDASGAYNDLWALNLGGNPTWSAIPLGGAKPSARGGALSMCDPLRDRIVVFGGYTQTFTPLNDAWQLSLAGTPAWTALAPTGVKPAPRFAAATVYDPTRDRFVISSGTDFVNFYDDTWQLSFSGTGTAASWHNLLGPGAGPTSRSDHKAVYDGVDDRLVFFGGINLGGILHDSWEMAFGSIVGVPGEEPRADAGPGRALALAGANPLREGTRLAFALPAAGPIELAVHDAAGRRVRTLASGWTEAGRHVVAWDARGADGRRAPAGVYFARLAGEGLAGGAATVKLVVLP